MRKVVVFMGDQRIYDQMAVACKSLLCHTPVDHVYFLIDTPSYPDTLPDIISTVNVHYQSYFYVPGPNYHPHYGYMTLMRAALSKVFPSEDIVLLLDPDTIVFQDISPIWDYDISNYYFAAVEETRNNDHKKHPYFNAGVMLLNLAKLRNDQLDDTIIRTINTVPYKHLEQDVLNFVCDKHILSLPSTYNYSFVSQLMSGEPAIRHFLSFAKPEWHQYARPYLNMSWTQALTKE